MFSSHFRPGLISSAVTAVSLFIALGGVLPVLAQDCPCPPVSPTTVINGELIVYCGQNAAGGSGSAQTCNYGSTGSSDTSGGDDSGSEEPSGSADGGTEGAGGEGSTADSEGNNDPDPDYDEPLYERVDTSGPFDNSPQPTPEPTSQQVDEYCARVETCEILQIGLEGDNILPCQEGDPDLPVCVSVGLDEPAGFTPWDPTTPAPPAKKPQLGGDPVVFATGTQRIRISDLSYPGPVRPLEFIRTYSSRSDTRGQLGSNWTHQFEACLIPVTPLVPHQPEVCYSKGVECLVYVDGTGNRTTFLAGGPGDHYFSPTGTSAVIAPLGEGWRLRQPDGRVLTFNGEGYLVEDRDRFGNGVRISQHKTPLFQTYEGYRLGDGPVEFPNEDPRLCAALAYAFGEDERRSWSTWNVPEGADNAVVNQECHDWVYAMSVEDSMGCVEVENPRVDFRTLGWDYVRFAPIPVLLFLNQCGGSGDDYWDYPKLEDIVLEPLAIQFALTGNDIHAAVHGCEFRYWLCDEYHGNVFQADTCGAQPWSETGGKNAHPAPTSELVISPDEGFLYEEIAYPFDFSEGTIHRERLREDLSMGVVDLRPYGRGYGMYLTPENPTGNRKYRVGRVDDDLVRALIFEYYPEIGPTRQRAGLLRSVRGPGGERVNFQYGRPHGYPKRLQEWFLTRVTRSRNTPLPPGVGVPQTLEGISISTKATDYHYDWPNGLGEGGYLPGLYQAWRPFVDEPAGRRVASLMALDYMSRVSDNLIAVVHEVGRAGGSYPSADVEVQTRYYKHPQDTSFDKVAGQKYGDNAQNFSAWQWNDPQFRVSYVSAPIGTGSLAWEHLPEPLRERFPLEGQGTPQLAEDPDHPLALYYPAEEAHEPAAPLSTRVPCGVIGERQRAFFSAGGEVDFSRLLELRQLAHQEANRICAWTKTSDQELQRRYYGFNFRGELLVRAVLDPITGRFLFKQRKRNEDGDPQVETAVDSHSTSGWEPERGGRRFHYQGVGTEWSLSEWQGKRNLRLMEEYPALETSHLPRTDLEDTQETPVVARLLAADFEPVFNLPVGVRRGVRLGSGAETEVPGEDHFEYEVLYAFDTPCQLRDLPLKFCLANPERCPRGPTRWFSGLRTQLDELDRSCASPSDPECSPVLDRSRASWAALLAAVRFQDRRALQEIHTRLEVFSAGVRGSRVPKSPSSRQDSLRETQVRRLSSGIRTLLERLLEEGLIRMALGGEENPCGRPAPSRVILRDPRRPETQREMQIDWAPHGLPRTVREVDGGQLRWWYYDSTTEYPFDSLSHDSTSPDSRGFAARVESDRFDTRYWREPPGPGCGQVQSPYRQAAAGNCQRLMDLGWPEPLAEVLAGEEGASNVSEFRYAITGWPTETTRNGLRRRFLRDIDGRILWEEQPDGSRIHYRYRPQGWVEELTLEGPFLEDERTRGPRIVEHFNSSGQVLRRCEELEVGGCDGFRGLEPNLLVELNPAYRLVDFHYDLESRLIRVEGYDERITEYEYDVRDLATVRVHRPRSLTRTYLKIPKIADVPCIISPNDSAERRAMGTDPGAFPGRKPSRESSWPQTDPDAESPGSSPVDSEHRRPVAHAPAVLPEL